MQKDEFDGELNDNELVIELLMFSTIPLLYITEDKQKDIEFYQRAVKINCMAIEWDLFGVSDKEIIF